MDLSQVTANARTIEITHPGNGENIGLRVTVLPPYDKRIKKVQRENLSRQLSSRQSKMSAAQIEANSLNVHVAAVESWEWYGEDTTFRGEKPECNEENVRLVFNAVPWIREQVRDAFDEEEAFFTA